MWGSAATVAVGCCRSRAGRQRVVCALCFPRCSSALVWSRARAVAHAAIGATVLAAAAHRRLAALAGRTLLLAAARPGLSAPRLPARAALFRVARRLGFQSPVGVSGEGVSSASAFPGSQPRPQVKPSLASLACKPFFCARCLFSKPASFTGGNSSRGRKSSKTA